MQGLMFLVVGLVSTVLLSAQPTGSKRSTRTDLIVSQKLGFSVVRPSDWFVSEGGDLPSFFNFPAEKAGPQGEFPPGGACIRILVQNVGG
jgi:hypothetical protein